MNQLVLSLFPGIGLLDMAFEEEGFTVVRGPDLLWGGDIRRFHVSAGKFDGVIGGPPCQAFSRLRHLNPNAGKHGNMIPEYERIVSEARPEWFIMENVVAAPLPVVDGYKVRPIRLRDGLCGGYTLRERMFSFGTADGRWLEIPWHVNGENLCHAVTSDSRTVPVKMLAGGKLKGTVVAGHGLAPGQRRTASPGHRQGLESKVQTIGEMCKAQGLPEDFTDGMPFTSHGKRSAIGNGVPLPMGRAVARAVKKALGAMTYHIKLTHDRGDVEQVDMRTEQGRCWHCGARAVFPVDEDRQPYCSMCARPQIRPVPMVTRSRERLPIAAMETGGDE